MARQRMGQHFLGNLSWRKRILESLPRAGTEVWVEIGAGHGEMTQLLAADGRRVIAIEADPQLAAGLKKNAARWGDVEVVEGDVLCLDLEKITGERFRVYGNLPYYITSPILHQLFGYADQLVSIHIVIQLEVAERIVATPGRRDYGYLSAVGQFYTRPEIVFRIPPGAFRPPPRVRSALVHMTIPGQRASLKIADEKRFLEFIGACFGQKRKMLRNNLRAVMPDELIHVALAACGLRPDARAEQLSLTQFAALFSQVP
ncbi:MAG TPA: 16S rRNA (adenine(1518)-N(6)/adenine(1519)-N(6))-dimethyltransferase RsmA [Candidatus Limnocylindria bacterium]|nr:16S rRNA (adenine(1518)-N(6)/adenine(1519)-N(6))-dimethyltransferase RsmA [Candidatus Limnocylindria bacterium]